MIHNHYNYKIKFTKLIKVIVGDNYLFKKSLHYVLNNDKMKSAKRI